MLKTKNKKCVSCGREDQPWFSKKRCKNCATIEDSKPLKRGSTIKKQTEKNKSYRKSQSEIRNNFFSYHINLCKFSEESGVIIYEPNRSNICHLFSKSKHPSVQDNLYNYVYLTLEEHSRFDKLLFENNFEKLEKEFPNCWDKVVHRMKIVSKACTERTKFFIKFEEWMKSKQ